MAIGVGVAPSAKTGPARGTVKAVNATAPVKCSAHDDGDGEASVAPKRAVRRPASPCLRSRPSAAGQARRDGSQAHRRGGGTSITRRHQEGRDDGHLRPGRVPRRRRRVRVAGAAANDERTSRRCQSERMRTPARAGRSRGGRRRSSHVPSRQGTPAAAARRMRVYGLRRGGLRMLLKYKVGVGAPAQEELAPSRRALDAARYIGVWREC